MSVVVVVIIVREPLGLLLLLLLLLDHLVLALSSMAASPVAFALSAALNTWARGCALAARDIEHVHGCFLLLDGCGLTSFRNLHLARDDRVELVVFSTSVIDRIDLGRRTVVSWVGVDCARALLLQVDLLGFAPIEAIRVRLDLVLEHGLSHVVERADSDVGGGVVVTHDGLEVLHSEEESFDGATPLESVPVF